MEYTGQYMHNILWSELLFLKLQRASSLLTPMYAHVNNMQYIIVMHMHVHNIIIYTWRDE